eukprot:scaffold18282_cov79-Phaeocystis_antarctica.AAC.3
MQRHQKALRLAQTRRVQGNLPECRSASPHPPRQTASTEQLARVQRRRPPQQPDPTTQKSSCRRLPASDPHNHSRQVPAVALLDLLLEDVRRERGGRRVGEHCGGCKPARRQPVVQPIDELHHVNRVEAQLHEARLHSRESVARTVAQPIHHLRHYQLHIV